MMALVRFFLGRLGLPAILGIAAVMYREARGLWRRDWFRVVLVLYSVGLLFGWMRDRVEAANDDPWYEDLWNWLRGRRR